MNYRMMGRFIARLIIIEALFLLPALGISLFRGETEAVRGFLMTLTIITVFSGVLMLPVLPFIEDNEENILGIVRRASDSGARFIYTTMDVTLRGNQRQWFYDRLQERFPGVMEKYERTFGEAYACASPRAEELYAAFAEACDRAGIAYKMPDIIAASRARYQTQQLSLFDAQI